MILGVDIGNTTISFGLVQGQKVKKVWKIWTPHSLGQASVQLKKILQKILTSSKNLEAILICSVVPLVTPIVQKSLQKFSGIKPLVVGKDILVPIKNRYRNPKKVGQDRLVVTYAAKELYGAPCIVVDLGTAITFDIVSKKGEYLGGLIVPGIRLSIESLFKKTALLPKVNIEEPKELIGRDTKNSILSGIFYGYGALCDGMVLKIEKKILSKAKVIATGGHTRLMARYITRPITCDDDLIFKGMGIIAQQILSVKKVIGQRKG